MSESRLPPSDEWRCVRCRLVFPSPGEGRPPISCLSDLGGCGRETEWCEHENPVEGCEPCEKGYTRFFPALWNEARVQLYIEAEGTISLESQADDLRKVIEFTRPEDALLSILAAAQAYLGPGIRPEKCLAYVCFDGPKSSGKTVATEAVVEIAGGKMIRGGTLPAMIRILTEDAEHGPPTALGIDEVDSMQARLPDLQGILRTGNRWNAEYPISVPKGKGWETRLMNVGGFKVFNYSGEPDDATQTRCLMIRMHPVEDSTRAADLAVESLFNNPILAAIRHRLTRKGEIARKRWDSAKMEDHMRTPEFKARVARLDSILPRGKQLGAVLLAVADAMEWSDEAERVIASYIAERREDSLEPEREVLAEILSEHLDEMREEYVELQNADVLAWANQRLKDRGLTPISKFRWPSIRDGFGIESGRRSKGLLLRFGPRAFRALGIESMKDEARP